MAQWARPKWINGHHEAVNAKSKLFWLVWLVVVIGAILWLSHLVAHAAQPIVPKIRAIIIRQTTNTWFFAATAIDRYGVESDYSNEVRTTVTNHPPITLAWDASPSTNVVGYRVYVGRSSRTYTNSVSVGTNATVTFMGGNLYLPNRLVTIRPQSSTNALGPWSGLTNWPMMQMTNPPQDTFYRYDITRTNLP